MHDETVMLYKVAVQIYFAFAMGLTLIALFRWNRQKKGRMAQVQSQHRKIVGDTSSNLHNLLFNFFSSYSENKDLNKDHEFDRLLDYLQKDDEDRLRIEMEEEFRSLNSLKQIDVNILKRQLQIYASEMGDRRRRSIDLFDLLVSQVVSTISTDSGHVGNKPFVKTGT